MQRNGLTWDSYLQVAGGLLGLTWGLSRLRRGQGDWMTWTVTSLSAPVAVSGLIRWLPVPMGNTLRRTLPALARTLT